MGIQDSLGFWILWIPGVGFQILCVWNSDSGFQSILSWIPDFFELYYDSKAQNFGTRVFEFLYMGL